MRNVNDNADDKSTKVAGFIHQIAEAPREVHGRPKKP